jgi:hypothetical protein
MIRKKQSGKLAGALWKAAAASTAFKPRAGGAGAKLLQAAKEQSNGPDGITAVVPAPRAKSPEKPPEPAPTPEVKVSEAEPSPQVVASESKPDAKEMPEPEPQDDRKRLAVSGNDMRYLTTLGVDPSILDNKTSQFTEWLDFFSWVPGEKMRSLNSDEMKIDMERELNKAQAGGWLARFQEEDERVDAIKKGIDLAIDECDELDNLLTLYSVELSVSLLVPIMAVWHCSKSYIRPFKMTSPTSKHKDKACRYRQRTKSCSRESLSLCWRLAPSRPTTCRLCRLHLWKPRLALRKSKPPSSLFTRP